MPAPRPTLRAVAPLLVSSALLLGGPARAEETDYLPDNLEWNGLSELSNIARGMQLEVVLLEELDWSLLPERATLLLVYPTVELAPDHVLAFLRQGGRVLLADDFGRAGDLLGVLGIRREGGARARRYHDGNSNLPLAEPGDATSTLTQGVDEVVTNHPARFDSRLPTLLGFAGGGQLLVAGHVGSGRFAALSDPSVLINAMLRFPGNRQLALNLLGYLRPQTEGNRVVLVTGHFRAAGSPLVRRGAARPGGLQGFLADYGRFLGRVNDFAPTAPALRALSVVAGGLGLAALALFVPLPRRGLEGHWLRPKTSAAPRGTPDASADTAFAAALLREEVEEVLTERLAAPGPIFTVHPGWVVRRVRDEVGPEAARVCARLLDAMKNVSLSVSPGGIVAQGAVSRGDLAAMYDLSRRLLDLVGRDPFPETFTRTDTTRTGSDDSHG